MAHREAAIQRAKRISLARKARACLAIKANYLRADIARIVGKTGEYLVISNILGAKIMAHLVESMFYAGETPWHGLGVKLDSPATSADAIRAAGLDWRVEKCPLFLADGTQVKDAFATVRDSDFKALGVVGARYEPLQNAQGFEFFDSIVGEGAAVYHTAGSLCEGRKIWVLAKLPGEIVVKGNDIVDKFLLLSNSHDGSSAVQVKFTPIRVVCANTLNLAMKDGESVYNIRHTRSVSETINKIKGLMSLAHQNFELAAPIFQQTARVQIDAQQLKSFVELVLPMPAKSDEEAEASTRLKNTRLKIIDLFESEQTNIMPEIRGTVWAAYNAVTFYADHERGSDSKRLENAWFGQGAELKALAFQEAMKLAA